MPLPAEYNKVNVSGTYVYLNGSPVVGSVKFTGKNVAVSQTTDTIIIPATITATLDSSGHFSVNLPSTNDPDILPNGWTYTVEEDFTGDNGRIYEIDVPVSAEGTGINIADVAPVTPSAGDPTAFVTLSTYYNRSLPPIVSGQWRSNIGSSITNHITLTTGTERAQLLILPPGQQLQAIACWVTGTAASTNVRFGIRSDNGHQASTLLLDAGTLPANSGIQSIPITFTVPAGEQSGVPLWFTVTPQGTNSVTFIGRQTLDTRDGTTASMVIGFHGSQAQSSVTGALPAGFTSSNNFGTGPVIAVQAA